MPTVRRRRLGAALKKLREATALKPEQVAAELDVDRTTVNRIERGATVPKENILLGMLGLYGADSATSAELRQLRAEAQHNQRGWWLPYKRIADPTFLDMEETATRVRNWENMFVPGLLQTEDYARAIIEGIFPGHPHNPQRIEARVMRRTKFNSRSALLHALIDENVLHRKVGAPEVMREQIQSLRGAALRPNITIQIVPLSVGVHPGMAGSFVLFDFDDDPLNSVYVESRAGDLIPEDEPTLAGINIDWGRIHGAALTPEDSATLLAELLQER